LREINGERWNNQPQKAFYQEKKKTGDAETLEPAGSFLFFPFRALLL
jgi:hypothetical protein